MDVSAQGNAPAIERIAFNSAMRDECPEPQERIPYLSRAPVERGGERGAVDLLLPALALLTPSAFILANGMARMAITCALFDIDPIMLLHGWL